VIKPGGDQDIPSGHDRRLLGHGLLQLVSVRRPAGRAQIPSVHIDLGVDHIADRLGRQARIVWRHAAAVAAQGVQRRAVDAEPEVAAGERERGQGLPGAQHPVGLYYGAIDGGHGSVAAPRAAGDVHRAVQDHRSGRMHRRRQEVVVPQPVTAPPALRMPTRTVATGFPLALLSPPMTYRYELPVTGELLGVATTAAAYATGAGSTVALFHAPSAPVLDTVVYSTLSRGVSVLSAPPTT